MKKRLLGLVILFFPLSGFSSAQTAEETLLDKAKQWVDQNLKCDQYDHDPNVKGFDFQNAPVGKCSEIGGKFFGHFDSDGSSGLVLEVNGGCWSGIHGTSTCDEKYVYCGLSPRVGQPSIFAKNGGGSTFEMLKFPVGQDLVRVNDERPYTEAGSSSIYGLVNGVMKRVLTFDYIAVCHQCTGGFQTWLSPLPDRKIKITTLMIDGDAGYGSQNYYGRLDGRVLRRIYYPDPATGLYQTGGAETLPLVKCVMDNEEDINSRFEIDPRIFDNDARLEELLEYLKLPKTDPKWKKTHELLAVIAQKDLGDTYEAWKKWKDFRQEDSQAGDD